MHSLLGSPFNQENISYEIDGGSSEMGVTLKINATNVILGFKLDKISA